MDLRPEVEVLAPSGFRRSDSDPFRRALQENEDWYQDLVEHSQDLLCFHDLTGRFLSMNPVPARVLGYSVEELLQIPMRELVVPEFRHGFDDYLTEIARTGTAHGLLAVMSRSGQRRIWRYHNTLRVDGSAPPIVRGIAHDITEQIHTEKLLRKSSEDLLGKVQEAGRTIKDLTLFRTLLDQSNDAIEVVDPATFRFLDVNEKACSDIGYSREELLSMSVFDINPSIDSSEIPRVCKELKKTRSIVVEVVHRRKDGSTFPVEVSLKKVHVDRDYIVAVVHNIAKRKAVESQLRSSESRYRTIHDLSPVGICWIDLSGRFLNVNPKYCEIVGLTEEELIGRTFQSITHPEDLEGNLEALGRLAAGEQQHVRLEKRYMRPDGSFRWVDVSVAFMPAERDTPAWLLAIVHDITERKQASEALRESAARERTKSKELETVLGLVPVAVCIAHDSECNRMTGNRAAYEQFGVPTGDNISQSAPTGERPLFRVMENGMEVPSQMLPIQQAAASGASISGRLLTIVLETGERRETMATAVPLFNEQGASCGAVAASVDITELRHAEEALKAAKEFSENLIQTANVLVLSLDMKGNVVLLNQAAEEITGYTFEDLKGRNWATLVPRDRFPGVWDEFDRMVAGAEGKTFENPILTKSGEERYIAWRNNPVKVDGQVIGTISFGIDITESKRVQENLRSSEEKYRLFVSQSSEGIFREDMDAPVPVNLPEDKLIHHVLHDHYMAECNDAMAEMYGLSSAKDLIGKRLTELLVADDPRNIELTRDFIRSGFRIIDRKSHEVDVHGNPKVFLNSMIGMVENGLLVGTWGIQRDITEKSKAEEARVLAEEALRQNVVELQKVTEDLRVAKEKLSEEKLYLEEAIGTELGFSEIIGRSAPLKAVMDKAAKVSPSNATVLLLGETGTGKELVARALHQMSSRKNASFIKMNCAAIPSGLLESELFGHEKGAFTGAVARKLGRLELADKGTLFLDEIGEISLALQPKLLRVLQDQEFERLGGTQTIKVDFRLLAATNRDLLKSVQAREFRSDLYYRLNVFPIVIPPLRDRRDDIPLLVEHFVRKYSARMNKAITSIPAKTMEALVQWSWPGNIRELENFMERSVILTPGMVLQVPLSELHAEPLDDKDMTLREKDRDRILHMLEQCKGQLGGPNGAAARLGLKRTTLQSKLSQLGITPGNYRAGQI